MASKNANISGTGSFHFTSEVKDIIGRLDLLADAIHIFNITGTNFYSFNYPAVVLSPVFLSQLSSS